MMVLPRIVPKHGAKSQPLSLTPEIWLAFRALRKAGKIGPVWHGLERSGWYVAPADAHPWLAHSLAVRYSALGFFRLIEDLSEEVARRPVAVRPATPEAGKPKCPTCGGSGDGERYDLSDSGSGRREACPACNGRGTPE